MGLEFSSTFLLEVSLCLKTMLKFRFLPFCCYPFNKQPIKIQRAFCLSFVIGWMLLHSLREGLTLPTLFHIPSSSPRGGEFRGAFVAIIVASSPGAAKQSFLLASEEQTAIVNPGGSFISLSHKYSSRVV